MPRDITGATFRVILEADCIRSKLSALPGTLKTDKALPGPLETDKAHSRASNRAHWSLSPSSKAMSMLFCTTRAADLNELVEVQLGIQTTGNRPTSFNSPRQPPSPGSSFTPPNRGTSWSPASGLGALAHGRPCRLAESASAAFAATSGGRGSAGTAAGTWAAAARRVPMEFNQVEDSFFGISSVDFHFEQFLQKGIPPPSAPPPAHHQHHRHRHRHHHHHQRGC